MYLVTTTDDEKKQSSVSGSVLSVDGCSTVDTQGYICECA